MLRARTLAVLCSLLALAAFGQPPDHINRVYHPSTALSYEVATIRPWDPATLGRSGDYNTGDTVRELIREAYCSGTSWLPAVQVIGGPAWIDKEQFKIDGKPPADLELAMRRMTVADRFQQQHAMLQSLLADRFHLKVHFEVRELPIYALVPAQGGLKMKEVAAPPPPNPANPPPPPALQGPLAPGALLVGSNDKGDTMFIRAGAISMSRFITALSVNLHQTGDRPVADETGFTGYFDIDNLRWADPTASTSDAPSLSTALEESLGIKLFATKGPVEVVVIDSIDHPSEN